MAEEDTGHTGGMIALMPREEDAAALAVAKGDPAGQMHLTLVYLGDDVTGMDTRLRNAIAATAANVAVGLPPVQARVFGHATLNPAGSDPDPDRDPCAVYLVGDSDLLGPVRRELAELAPGEQHEPFLAHVTAGYGVDQRKLSFTGPVTFDRLRVALGEEYYDFPLGEVMEKGLSALQYIQTKRRHFPPRQHKVMSPNPNAAKLREYWAHGKGRAKWRPGTPGDFERLRRQLRKYVKNPRILNGLVANIHKLATGEWPGRGAHGGGKDGMPKITAEEFKAAMLIADPDADLDELGDLMGGEDEDAETGDAEDGAEPDGEEETYEQALADDFLWNIDADGQLEPDRDAPVDDEEGEADGGDASVGPNPVAEAYSLF